MSTESSRQTNLYTVLGLPGPPSSNAIGAAQIKIAFRRVLLKNHPDKAGHLLENLPSKPKQGRGPDIKPDYDIDTICLARDTLLDSARRREYDRELINSAGPQTGRPMIPLHPTELDTIDLDDMQYDESSGSWYKTCRCGNTTAYEVSEEDLDIASKDGTREVLVNCGDCSLFVRVVFEAVEGE